MPRRKLIFAPGEYYHLYNRGVNRDLVYFSRDNHVYFLRKLREYFFDESSQQSPEGCALNSTVGQFSGRAGDHQRPVQIICYCLIPNHYHLLVRLHCNDLSGRMQSISQAYTNAINKSLSRVGPLFQGRFQARHVEREEYLIHVSRYVHLNPVVAGLVRSPADWEFSSYRDIIGLRESTSANRLPIPEPEPLFRTFESVASYRAFVEARTVALPERMRHLAIDESSS